MTQPVQVLYGGAHLFRAGIARRAGEVALKALDEHGYPLPLPEGVDQRVREKLQREPVEDFRIDFEDGYGARSESEEDGHAAAAADLLVSEAAVPGALPRRMGVRVKAFEAATEDRALKTLEIFLKRSLPAGFVVTLPKITDAEQVWRLSKQLKHHDGIGIELLIETPRALRHISQLVDACEGRCVGAHFGAYDYMASLGITSAEQTLLHPACDYARSVIQVAVAELEVPMADGVTNLLPVGDTRAVHAAWKAHAECVRHALKCGIYQGWDVHPAQLVSRYATVFSFFREHLDGTLRRLANYMDRATRLGNQFDDEATVRGLRQFTARAVACGAATAEEVHV